MELQKRKEMVSGARLPPSPPEYDRELGFGAQKKEPALDCKMVLLYTRKDDQRRRQICLWQGVKGSPVWWFQFSL